MIRIDGFTKRGFHYVAEFYLPGDAGVMKGKVTILGSEFRCWYAEVMLDIERGQRSPVIKVFWSDLSDYVREVYLLHPGQSLLISLPIEKFALFRAGHPDDVLEFARAV